MSLEMLMPESNVGLLEREEKKMATGSHSGVAAKLVMRLGMFQQDKEIGHVLDSSATYNFRDNKPGLQPDASFIPFEKLAELPNEELTVVPDLVAEVVSTNDTLFEINQKIVQYQNAGVKLIWIIQPDIQAVQVFRLATGTIGETKGSNDELDGEDVLPGFKLAVRNLFVRIAPSL
jgi:Uma2 family endonuclease